MDCGHLITEALLSLSQDSSQGSRAEGVSVLMGGGYTFVRLVEETVLETTTALDKKPEIQTNPCNSCG